MDNEANRLYKSHQDRSGFAKRFSPVLWSWGGRLASLHFRRHPPVFILGAARSGTTLLFQILASQPRLTALFEPNELWWMALGRTGDDTFEGVLTGRGRRQLRWLYYSLLLPAGPILLSKDPRDSVRAGLLHGVFPSARFVHIVRDGRDVVASACTIWRGESHRVDKENDWVLVRIPGYETLGEVPAHIKASMMWEYSVRKTKEDLSRVPEGQQFTVRYEELVAEPAGVATALVDSLLGGCDPAALERVLANVSQTPRRTDSNPARDVTDAFDRSWVPSDVIDDAGSGTMSRSIRVGKWRTELGEQEIEESLEILGPMLRHYRYED